ncbi:MAG: amidohydrolase [Acidobacteria bacterium]|nr:amidohydrolase [Acidobacteriota bacterium]
MTARAWLVLSSVVFAAACGGSSAPAPAATTSPAPAATGTGEASLIIVNGKVHTMDDAGTVSQAVAVKGNTILKVGTSDEIKALAGPATQVIDARGGTVAPGFNDAHVHFVSGGQSLGDVDLSGLTTLQQVQDKIREFAAAKPDLMFVKGRGWLYSPFTDASPTKAQLDLVVPDRPAVMTCYDGHSVWVNTKVLTLAGITKDTKDPVNGVVVRDPKTGEPTGHLKEAAMDLIAGVLPAVTDEIRRAALGAAVAHANKLGLTSVQNAGGSLEEMAIFDAARKSGALTVRTYLATAAEAGISEADVDKMEAARKQYGDDPTVRTGIVKMFADGVIESKTAAMLAPYVGTKSPGAPNMSAAEMNRIVAMFDKRGWQIEIHAIGYRAIRMALDAFENAAKVNPAPARGRRHRLEHIEAVSAQDIARFGTLGVIASQQPIHAALGDVNQAVPAGPWPDAIGPERAARAWAWKSIQAAGGRLAFGSDWPVAPLDPGQGLWLASTRVKADKAEDQRLTLDEALSGYTKWAAYASFDEQRKGTLAPGMLADIVVLGADLAAAPIAAPTGVTVAATIFDGKVVYEKR